MLRYSLRQLEYFRTVAITQSVADAARELNVSQPSISAAIAKLENQLGVQLFIRQHARGMKLTPAGRRLAGEARNLLRHAEELQRDATSDEKELSGELHLASFMTAAARFMPSLISSFRTRHPKVSVRLKEGDQQQLLEALRAGIVELGLLYSHAIPDDFIEIPLAAFPPYALMPDDHPLAAKPDVSLAELAREPMILFDVAPSRDYFLSLFENAGVSPQINFASPSLELVRGLVGKGEGISVLVTRPPGDVTYDGQPLAIRPLRDKVEASMLTLVRHVDLRSNHLMDAFCTVAREQFARSQQEPAP